VSLGIDECRTSYELVGLNVILNMDLSTSLCRRGKAIVDAFGIEVFRNL
jgi:hypothetical protein